MATFAEQMVEKLQAILLANAGLASVSVDSRDGRAGGPGGEAGALAGQGQPSAWHGPAGGDDHTWGAERMIASRQRRARILGPDGQPMNRLAYDATIDKHRRQK